MIQNIIFVIFALMIIFVIYKMIKHLYEFHQYINNNAEDFAGYMGDGEYYQRISRVDMAYYD